MGYYQQVCGIFKFESFNTAHQKKAFHSNINEKKDVFVTIRDQVNKLHDFGVSAVSLLS
jgi:hypothetical protein